jgi:cell division protein FtsQ
LRSLAEEGFRYERDGDRDAKSRARNASQGSWLSRADAFADKAASIGFLASMVFLAVTAIYAFSLSGIARLYLAEAFALADKAAFDAGFKLQDFAITGSQNTPQAALLDALKLPYKGSSLFYDAAQARERLLNLGWIQSAEVRRVLPSRLEVIISERVPFAQLEDAEHKLHVIDREGHLLGSDQEGRFKALPIFAGEGAGTEAANFEDAFQDRASLRGRMGRIELVAERFWNVKLETGLMLKLPRKVTPLTLERLDSLLANPRIAGLGLETIDLRLSNRTILQLLEPTVANRDKAIAVLTSAQSQASPPPRRGKAL